MVDIHLASDVCDLMQICMRCARQHQMQISPYITLLMSSVVEVWQIGLTQETSSSIVPAIEEESVVDACVAVIVAYEDEQHVRRKQRLTSC